MNNIQNLAPIILKSGVALPEKPGPGTIECNGNEIRIILPEGLSYRDQIQFAKNIINAIKIES